MADYNTYRSLNPSNPNGSPFGWRGFCDVKNVDTMREAASAALLGAASLELVNVHTFKGAIRSVYKDSFGCFIAVEKVG